MSNDEWNQNGSDGWSAPDQGGQNGGSQPQEQGWGDPNAGQPPQDQGWQQPQQAQQNMVHAPQTQPSGKKSFPKLEGNDIIILVLTFFFPGSGHIMMGQTAKGVVILAAVFLTCGAGYIALLAILADAFLCLVKKKETGQLEDWEFFPNYSDYM